MTTLVEQAVWVHSHGNVWQSPEGDEYTLEILRITPEWAKEILRGSDGEKESRNFREPQNKRVAALEGELVNNWKFNGASIVIDADGYVRDGQKRLEACINSGVAFDSVVVWGIADDADLTIDKGERRTLGQVLRHAKEPEYNVLASVLTLIYKIRNKKELASIAMSAPEALKILKANPTIRDSIKMSRPAREIIAHSLCAAIHFECSQHNPAHADRFFKLLGSGANLAEDDPIYLLRLRMATAAKAKAKLPSIEKMALLILAWNAWVAGRPLRQLKWTSVGPAAMAFPKLQFPVNADAE